MISLGFGALKSKEVSTEFLDPWGVQDQINLGTGGTFGPEKVGLRVVLSLALGDGTIR